jgi:hypothetical protein
MFDLPPRVLLVSLVLAAAGASAATVGDGNGKGGNDDTGGADTAADISPWAGDWTGFVTGYAAFDGTDWEVDPYCDGDVSLTVTIRDPASDRGFEAVALEGKVDTTSHSIAVTEYTRYTPVGLDPIDAAVRLSLN